MRLETRIGTSAAAGNHCRRLETGLDSVPGTLEVESDSIILNTNLDCRRNGRGRGCSMASRTLGAAAVLGLLALIAGCGKTPAHKPTPEAGPTVRAKTETVAKQALGADYEAVGAVRSKTVSTIQSQVVEPVKAVHVKEGDRVEAGALLVELDDREISTQARKAESGLKEAQSALEEIGKSINAAESAKAAADANSALAKATFERYKGLADSQAVSRQMFDEAAARHKAASAQAAQAADMVRSVQAKRGEVEARLEQAKAAIENARVLLIYTKILAPIAGLEAPR